MIQTMSVEEITIGAYALAFGAGIVSFLSPCVLPIVPAYLSVVTGLDITAPQSSTRRLGIFRDTALFVSGFTAVFVTMGLISTSLGRFLVGRQVLLTRLSGVVIIALALFMAGSLVLRAPWLYQEKRFHLRRPIGAGLGPLVAGLAFGFGWSPCIGPILGSILTIAARQEQAVAGGSLLAAYSAGLGASFLGAGLAFDRLSGLFGFVKRRMRAMVAGSALVLGLLGVVLVLNRMAWLSATLGDALRAIGLDVVADLAEI